MNDVSEIGAEEAPVALVLLHGFPFEGSLWDEVRDRLSAESHLEVFAPDLPGFGSAPTADDPTMDAYAEHVAGWMRSEGLERAVLAGHSMGGYVAFAFARHHARMLRGLVLISTRAGADSETARQNRFHLIDEVHGKGAQAVVDAMLPKLFAPGAAERIPEAVESTREMMLRQSVDGLSGAIRAMAVRPDSTPYLHQISCPTLVVSGEDDMIIPADDERALATGIAGAQRVVVPGAGHMSMLERPDAFVDALRGFLSQL